MSSHSKMSIRNQVKTTENEFKRFLFLFFFFWDNNNITIGLWYWRHAGWTVFGEAGGGKKRKTSLFFFSLIVFVSLHMCRVFPKPPTPAWEAPLLNPAWSPMWPSWARNCSSVNSRSFLSAIYGPMRGPVYSGCFWVCADVAWHHHRKIKSFQKQKIEQLHGSNEFLFKKKI